MPMQNKTALMPMTIPEDMVSQTTMVALGPMTSRVVPMPDTSRLDTVAWAALALRKGWD